MTHPWSSLGFTSGRRTYAGNRKVGGRKNSGHLDGTNADFTAPYAEVRRQFPNNPILDEGDHRHVSGLSNVPYHGKNGTIGLVNGIDTSAPKGSQMQQPMRQQPRQHGMGVPYYPNDPITDALMPRPEPMSGGMPQGGMMQQQPQMGQMMQQPQMQGQMQGQMEQQPQSYGAVTPPGSGRDPLAPKPKFLGKGGMGWTILGIIGDAMAGYGGQQGSFGPAMAAKAEGEREDNQFQQRLEADRQAKREAIMAKANEPMRFENNSGDQLERDPRTGQVRVLYADPTGKTQYARITDPVTGEISITPQGESNRPNQGHIQHLMQSGDKRNFDAKFGPGMADYYLRTMGGQ